MPSSTGINTGRRDTQQNKTNPICNGKNSVAMKENKNRGQWSKHTMVGALPTNTQPIQRRWAHDQEIQRVWFGKGGGGGKSLFSVSSQGLFQKCFAGMAFFLKEVVDSWDHLMHIKKVGSEKPQGPIHSNEGERLIARLNKREIFHVTSSGRKIIHQACSVVVVGGQPTVGGQL